MRRRGMSRYVLILGLVAMASCASISDEWTYSLTRSMWGSLSDGSGYAGPIPPGRPSEPREEDIASTVPFEAWNGAEAFGALASLLIVLPIAIDTVLLPVTVPHDLMVE
jgi:hypothetical protein